MGRWEDGKMAMLMCIFFMFPITAVAQATASYQMVWSPDATFCFLMLIIFGPWIIIGSILFYQRREIQPIKGGLNVVFLFFSLLMPIDCYWYLLIKNEIGRIPSLVLLEAFFLFLFLVFSSVRKIFGDSYSCALSIWSEYLNTITIANTFIIRSWLL